MAIKVGGTTVIDDSRALNNITSVDATTVAALGTAGVGAGGGVVGLTADGAISSTDPVILTDTGKAASVTISTPPLDDTEWLSSSENNNSVLYHQTNDKYIAIYRNGSDIDYKIGTPSNGSISWSSTTTLRSGGSSRFAAIYNPSENLVIFIQPDGSHSDPVVRKYSLSGNTLTDLGGSQTKSGMTTTNYFTMCYHPFSQTVFCAFTASNSTIIYGLCIKNTDSGLSANDVSINGASLRIADVSASTTTDRIFIQYREANTSGDSWISRGSISASGTINNFDYDYQVGNYQKVPQGMAIDKDGVLVAAFYDQAASGISKYVRWDFIGGPVSQGSSSRLPSYSNPLLMTEPNTGTIYVTYVNNPGANGSLRQFTLDTSSTISESAETTIVSSDVSSLQGDLWNSEVTSYAGYKQPFTYTTSTNSTMRSRTLPAPSTNLSSTNLLGLASETKADGESVDIAVIGPTVDGYTGLTIGSLYYVQEDGTITTSSTDAQLIGKAISATKILITQV
jgi:hypothetical protein